MKTALVTGGLGFIGSNLVKILLKKKDCFEMYIIRFFCWIYKSIKG